MILYSRTHNAVLRIGDANTFVRLPHLRVNFCPAITGAAAVDFEFAFPHIGHAIIQLVKAAYIAG
jgi:hypothetical protein